MNGTNNQQNGPVTEIVAEGQRVVMRSRLVLGLLVWAAVSFGALIICFWLDNILHLPSGLRLALSLGGVGLMAFALYRNVLSPILRPQGLETTALLLERKYDVPENLLVNALCFEPRRLSRGEKAFARQTIGAAASLMSKADLKELWQSRKITKWSIVVSAVVLLWGIYGITQSRYAVNALARFVRPLADVPPAGSVALKITPSRDITVAEADNVPVSVEVIGRRGSRALQSYPEIVWLEDADQVSADWGGQKYRENGNCDSAIMQAAEDRKGVYSHTFAAVDRSFAFRVFAADSYSPSIKVPVNRVPRIAESQFHISPPSYTGLGPVSTAGPPGAVSGLAGSKLAVDVKLDGPAEGLWWKAFDRTIAFAKKDQTWRAETQLTGAGAYEIAVKRQGVDKRITIASGSVLLQQDSVPKVQFEQRHRDHTVNPGQRVKFDIRAADDLGIAQTYVTLRQMRADSETQILKRFRYDGPPGRKGQVTETLSLPIDAGTFKPGYSYVLQAFCRDFSPTGNVGQSHPVTLSVKSLQELTIEEDDPRNAAFAALEKAIEAQQSALGVTKNILTNLDDVIGQSESAEDRAPAEDGKSLRRHRAELQERQKRVGTHMTEAWDVSTPPRPAFVRKLVALRDGEHTSAMQKIQMIGVAPGHATFDLSVLSAMGAPAQKSAISRSLESVRKLQAFLLEQLIALKGVLAKESQTEAEKMAEDILGQADDAFDTGPQDTLKEMVTELEQFGTKQKEIMHQRQMIMDQPPEDFSEDDEDELEELALDQSRLAEVLSNVVNDFTNLDLQDFGDDALVESMKSLYEQAEDLSETADEAAEMRQARVDAHRLETETVEMAEELMINCEATLGYYDSIQFIAEVPEDEQLVAPLAELPYELEDLVADLITSEEEMRPEVEDIGSYLNSLDHTAGPVSDGTISSTSAKGKTGDQKPEDNIIQGRSGAGRSGMSDGQLVEPVAKALSDNEYGLRERISNTPLESGQVTDEDTKAQTGGTGLGKTTDDSSPFGPGGRLPPRVLDMMRATTQKQLNIRQSAQELVRTLRRHNLPAAGLESSIQAMKQVEKAIDARSGIGIRRAYSQAVDGLKKSHNAIGKQLAVQYTSDKALAKKLEDMLSQKQPARFKGYEHIIGAYFEALAREDH